jgi:hypothetical protein
MSPHVVSGRNVLKIRGGEFAVLARCAGGGNRGIARRRGTARSRQAFAYSWDNDG